MTHDNKAMGRSHDVEGIHRMMSSSSFVQNWPKCLELPTNTFFLGLISMSYHLESCIAITFY